MDTWLENHLVCPSDHGELAKKDGRLVCPSGHEYPVVEGVPVLLVKDVEQTAPWATRSIERAESWAQSEAPEEPVGDEVHPHVQELVAATSGYLYQPLVHKLSRYPIPELRLPDGDGRRLLDLGCNWGRWTIAAARKGYRPVGIDPSIDAVLAAKQICRQLGLPASFLVADARYLPFRDASFDVVFSYSVLQHFSKENACAAISEAGRVLRPNSVCLIQMPNAFGLRCLYHQAKRGFGEPGIFDVRYWTLPELERTFQARVGTSTLSVDGFFGLGIQKNDIDLLPLHYRAVVHASEALRALSARLPFMRYAADSIYVRAVRDR
jgi:SAM-dependent methyltransferase/uncharacterized protein YbaR (Trm112 family)